MHSPPLRPHADATTPATPPLALVASAACFVGYFVALHVLIVHDLAPWLSIALIVAPWIAALATTLRAAPVAGRRVRLLLVSASVAALGVLAWTFGERLADRVDVLLYAENLLFMLVLCGLFATTLSGDREPLVTRLARRSRGGHLPQEAESYTRAVTIVWAVFFAAMALVSTLLFVTQSRTVWSTFVNLLIWPSMAALFAVEYGVRLRVLRDIPHGPMMRGVDAFRQRHAADPMTAPGVHE